MEFEKDKKQREFLLQCFQDCYQVVFSIQRGADGKNRKAMILTNVETQAQRRLARQVSLNGPFLEVKTQKWYITNPEDSEEEVEAMPDHISAVLTRMTERA